MKRLLITIGLIAFSLPAFAQHPDRTDVVAQAKGIVVANGVDITTVCGSFAITKQAVWMLRSEGAGLFLKPTGNNCDGFSVDIIAYQDGSIYDVIAGSQTTNTPAFNFVATDPTNVPRWATPIDPGLAPGPSPNPVPAPTPTPAPTVDLAPLLNRLNVLEARAAALEGTVRDGQTDTNAKINAVAASLAVLGSRPIPTSCSASINLGTRIPISCHLN